MSKTHFIAMAGLHGYLPNYYEVFPNYKSAVDDLVQLHELGTRRARILKRDGYIELHLQRDGNEYAEIEECTCDNPAVHSDNEIDESEYAEDAEEFKPIAPAQFWKVALPIMREDNETGSALPEFLLTLGLMYFILGYALSWAGVHMPLVYPIVEFLRHVIPF